MAPRTHPPNRLDNARSSPPRPGAARAAPPAERRAAHPHPPPAPRGSAAAIPERPANADDVPAIVSHPDGWYWLATDGHQQFGPFETYELARADRDAWDEESPTPGETLQEAEDEIGIASWIDPDTGEPAEGGSPPHLDIDER
jgi:hypothetical protein